MGRPKWTTIDQFRWLETQIEDYFSAKKRSALATFFGKLVAEWEGLFPYSEMPGGATRGEQRDLLRTRLHQWFGNHTRKMVAGSSKPRLSKGMLNLGKRSQVLHPYQAYLKLYNKKLRPTIDTKYAEYKAGLGEGETPQDKWPFTIKLVQQLLNDEDEDVKAEVEAARRDGKDFDMTRVLGSASADVELRDKEVRAKEKAIDSLDIALSNIFKNLQIETGLSGTIILGGSHPRTGDTIIYTYHHLENVNGQSWDQAMPDFKTTVEAGFAKHLVECGRGGKPKDDSSPTDSDGDTTMSDSSSEAEVTTLEDKIARNTQLVKDLRVSTDAVDSSISTASAPASSPSTSSGDTPSSDTSNPTAVSDGQVPSRAAPSESQAQQDGLLIPVPAIVISAPADSNMLRFGSPPPAPPPSPAFEPPATETAIGRDRPVDQGPHTTSALSSPSTTVIGDESTLHARVTSALSILNRMSDPILASNASTDPPSAAITTEILMDVSGASSTETPTDVSSTPMDVDSGSSPAANDEPAWMVVAVKYFEAVGSCPSWVELVLKWRTYEKRMDYADGNGIAFRLPTACRPPEIGRWLKTKRCFNKSPLDTGDVPAYVAQFKQWYLTFQPEWRQPEDDDNAIWPPSQVLPEPENDWSDTRRSGQNGLFVALLALSWWYTATKQSLEPTLYVDCLKTIKDLAWVFDHVGVPGVDSTAGIPAVTLKRVSSTKPPSSKRHR
ncbi:hypothetical protein EUX98_g8181 [Antrodiella citrinella]|uniref:Uncharacterized protein n=1 Tax=Antrodiella citrinella TaxID=2447956 RepID=A0A4S4MD22_9APHY|nr:hypothetical protein EUX98_g8181 [Antrodiella citrinella]